MAYITEQAKQIPIAGTYDVIVSGGGIAGVAAALAAARQGAKTLLIEKLFMLGGLATAGLITIYLPLCDGEGHQVSFGLAEELLRLSVKHGRESFERDEKPNPWLSGGTDEEKKAQRFHVRFNASVFAILCEQLLKDEGVDILYGTSVCEAAKENGRITAVITENKSGREAYTAKSFVDASGDADLCKLAGESTAVFAQGNVLAAWYYEVRNGKYLLHGLGAADIPDKYKTKEKIEEDTRPRFLGLDGEELSRVTVDSHGWVLDDFLKKGGVSVDHALASMATTPQVRMTRRLAGRYTLDDTESFTRFEDSIGLISDWRKDGPVYELPLRCLIGDKVPNLICCGRCISNTDAMWDITRVIPVCAVTGEAAGIAAAMTDDFGGMDVAALQAKLVEAGVKLHIDEVLS